MRQTAITRRPSKAKRDFDAEYAAVRPSVIDRGCEFNAYSDVQSFCYGPLLAHHAKGRRAKDANSPENLRCLCERHHVIVHMDGRWSREVGLMLSRIS